MMIRNNVESRIVPWVILALIPKILEEWSFKTTLITRFVKKMLDQVKYSTRETISLQFVKKTSMPNLVKCL